MSVAEQMPQGLRARLIAWGRHHIPTRESIEANRLLRPIAHLILQPSLWRLNRRSVARGVAVGAFTSVVCPVAHTGAAAILSIPVRANLPVAVGVTIPSTLLIPTNLLVAYHIGHWILHPDRKLRANATAAAQPGESWLHWIAEQGPSTILGLLILATILATVGYFAAGWIWRVRVMRKWRHRHALRLTQRIG